MTASDLNRGQLFAADRVEFHFEEMTIPIPIDELNNWNKGLSKQRSSSNQSEENVSDLSFWLNLLGFKTVLLTFELFKIILSVIL